MINQKIKPKIIIVTPELSDNCGICRAISTLCYGISDKGNIIITNKFNSSSHKIPDNWKVFEVIPHNKILSIVYNAIYIKKCVGNQEIFINTHTLRSHLSAILYKLFFNKKAKIISIVYDHNELKQKKLFDKIGFVLFSIATKLNIVNLIIVLDKKMETYTKNVLNISRIKILRIGIHPNLIKNYRKKIIKRNSIILYFHGIIVPHRHLEDVIESLKIVEERINKKIIFLISGYPRDKKYFKYLKNLSKKIKSKVYFIGSISDKKLINNYINCDIFLWPSVNQTWGLAPLEAMFFNKPVIVSYGSGVSEVLNNKISELIKPGSEKETV